MVLSQIPVMAPETSQRRETFFRVIFDTVSEGYVCIARRVMHKGAFEEKFFAWPNQLPDMLAYINESVMGNDLWFCPMTFDAPHRKKENVLECPSVWSDLDGCSPSLLLVEPTVCLQSSENRHQALWILNRPADPADAEDASKRIAYYHEEDGADKSGWDITQLLRVPFTLNYKYNPPAVVTIASAGDTVALEDLNVYPVVAEDIGALYPYPDSIEDSETVMQRYRSEMHPRIFELVALKPTEDWSKALWSLEMLLCETAMTREEVFSITREAACNKYRRDGKSDKLLWKEVCKAWAKVRERNAATPDASVYKPVELLSDEDIRSAAADKTFVDEYIEWASGVGDAAPAYHQAGGFVCLSSILAGAVRLPTSYGTIVPNLWFMLLADTTLTRKSTALDLAIDLLVQVDPDAVMATDGSIEGLFSSLAFRPGQPSVFLRDEFSGLLESMVKKDYYAGMAETLTKMYDGKFQKRVLRREVIEVKDPILILFAGGIKTKILSLLQYEHVSSGFLPRFIFITAKSDIQRLRPLGPPSESTLAGREAILRRLMDLRDRYKRTIEIKAGSVVVPAKQTFDAQLTPGAWAVYNEMERRLLESGLSSGVQDLLTPTMDRLAKSGLKVSMLIAAARQKERVVVDERDIYKAFSYVTEWREYAMEVISNIGQTAQERLITQVYNAVMRNPGVLRSTIMQNYHLTKRDADNIFDTLEQRGKLNRVRSGRSEKLSVEM